MQCDRNASPISYCEVAIALAKSGNLQQARWMIKQTGLPEITDILQWARDGEFDTAIEIFSERHNIITCTSEEFQELWRLCEHSLEHRFDLVTISLQNERYDLADLVYNQGWRPTNEATFRGWKMTLAEEGLTDVAIQREHAWFSAKGLI